MTAFIAGADLALKAMGNRTEYTDLDVSHDFIDDLGVDADTLKDPMISADGQDANPRRNR